LQLGQSFRAVHPQFYQIKKIVFYIDLVV